MVAIFTLFCIVFIDSGNKHKILNKMIWKLPALASHFFPPLPSHLLLGTVLLPPPPANSYFLLCFLNWKMVMLTRGYDLSIGVEQGPS